MIDIEEFIDGYVEAALWADCLPMPCPRCDGEGVLRGPSVLAVCERCNGESEETGGREDLDITPEARETIAADCRAFIAANRADLDLYAEQRSYDPSQGSVSSYAGHDAYLTSHRHGAGFWDRGLGELGDRLTESAHAMLPEDRYLIDCGDGTAEIF